MPQSWAGAAVLMDGMWLTLLPLIIGGAAVPIEVVITLLLLRSSAGRVTAIAWILGMTTVRLVQGLVFGLLLSPSGSMSGEDDQSVVVASILLVVAVLFYVTAVRQLLRADDPDQPPPKWLVMTETMRPWKAFLIGAGLIVIGVKFWVFTLGAIAAIREADLDRAPSIAVFLVFVFLTVSIHVAIVGVAYAAPERSAATLDRVGVWLRDHNRAMVIGLGLVFGTWFLVKAMSGLGII